MEKSQNSKTTTVAPKAPVQVTTTEAPVTTTVAPVTTLAPVTTEAPVTTQAPALSSITDDINELTNPAAEDKTKTEETVEVTEVVERRRTKKVEIMEPVNTDFPIYNEPKRRR